MPHKIITKAKADNLDPAPVNMRSVRFLIKVNLMKMNELGIRIVSFYVAGFRRMKLGRTLWAIILIKLLIMFGVLKIFFFPDYLHENFTNDMERADHVSTSLTQIPTQK
jgi:TM2 domain-containing membrane protein YozV